MHDVTHVEGSNVPIFFPIFVTCFYRRYSRGVLPGYFRFCSYFYHALKVEHRWKWRKKLLFLTQPLTPWEILSLIFIPANKIPCPGILPGCPSFSFSNQHQPRFEHSTIWRKKMFFCQNFRTLEITFQRAKKRTYNLTSSRRWCWSSVTHAKCINVNTFIKTGI